MIVTPFAGTPAGLTGDCGHFVDGRSGKVTSYQLTREALIPAHAASWVIDGAASARTTQIADASGSNDVRGIRVTYPAQSCSPGDRYKGDTPETAALAGQNRPDGGMHYLRRIPRSDHARLTYSVRFPVGFDWRGGGKMPGLCSASWAASGGVTDPAIAGVTSWTARMMWRPEARMTPYYYMADNRDARWDGSAFIHPSYPGDPSPDPDFSGSHIFATPVFFTPGSWDVIEQEVRMNTPGVPDGWAIVKFNGQVIAYRRDILWRKNYSLHIDSVFMSSFFGGNTLAAGDASPWFTPVTQTVDYSDMSVTLLD